MTVASATPGAGRVPIADGTGKLDPAWISATGIGATSIIWTATQSFPDSALRVVGSSDSTKQLAFEVDGFTTATVRTWTYPDRSDTVAGLGAQTFTGLQTISGGLTFTDANNLAAGTTTGTKIGTATAQKLGFWNVTPVIQPAGAAQAAAAAQGQASLTDSTGGSATTTLAAITAGVAYAQADLTAVKNALASIAAQLALIKTDVTNVKTLEDAMRTALVNSGIMKGAA